MLLSEKTWKLADFNLACNFVARPGKLMRNKAGSRPFMAPEVQEKGRPGVWLGHLCIGTQSNIKDHPVAQGSLCLQFGDIA